MITQDQTQQLIGSMAYDSSGSKVGKVGQVYLDGRSGDPKWATAETGMFGTSESFFPIHNASLQDGKLNVAYGKETIKEAPRVEKDQELLRQDESALYRHYEMDSSQQASGSENQAASGDSAAAAATEDRASQNRSSSGSDEAMTRSEEELRVGTEQRESGTARLRKYVVTEEQQVNVPVSHEEVRVEREPITDANRAEAVEGAPITEDEHEVTLHEERPVTSKEAHPVERVRMEKETVHDEETVRDEVRKERIEAENTGDQAAGAGSQGRHHSS